ncbi:MAG: 50S ribosomal protein L25 [Bacillota bacterium]
MQARLEATIRAAGKGAAHRVREQGGVPAIVYGHGLAPVPITVDGGELKRILATAGRNALIQLDISATSTLSSDVMIKDIQVNLLKGAIDHVDFVRVSEGETITVEVPIVIRGEEELEKAGLVIQHQLRQVHVQSLPGTVPEAAYADVAGLTHGQHLVVAQLTLPGDAVIVQDPDEIVLNILAPRAVEAKEEETDIEEEVKGEAPKPE